MATPRLRYAYGCKAKVIKHFPTVQGSNLAGARFCVINTTRSLHLKGTKQMHCHNYEALPLPICLTSFLHPRPRPSEHELTSGTPFLISIRFLVIPVVARGMFLRYWWTNYEPARPRLENCGKASLIFSIIMTNILK